MRGTVAPHPGMVGPEGHRGGWLGLAWKVLLAFFIVAFMLVETPLSRALDWGFLNPVPTTLLLWGALVVGVASNNLFEGAQSIRWAWGALAVGAYLAMTIPGVLVGSSRLIDTVGPVAALTLVAHLGRRDLQRALRDWAFVMALSLYVALGVQAMLMVSTLGLGVFLVAALIPPILLEALLLLLRRTRTIKESWKEGTALVFTTLISTSVISLTQFNPSTPFLWSLFFHLLLGLFVGGALLVSLLTRPMVLAASGSQNPLARWTNLGRTLVELSHGPILISLALYIPLRLLGTIG